MGILVLSKGVLLLLCISGVRFSNAFLVPQTQTFTHMHFFTGSFEYATQTNLISVDRHTISATSTTNLFMSSNKKNKYDSSNNSYVNKAKLQNENLNMDGIISQGIQASESWDIFATPFLNYHDSNTIKSKLNHRADVKLIEVGSIPTSSVTLEDTQRTRLIITNPDLELDSKQIEKEYCSMVQIDNFQSVSNVPEATSKSKPWPQMFMKIGIDLETVGEVVVEEETGIVYFVVLPEVVKQCIRLLPKVLRGGVGITVSGIEFGDYIPYDGIQQDMELGVLDKRSLQYK